MGGQHSVGVCKPGPIKKKNGVSPWGAGESRGGRLWLGSRVIGVRLQNPIAKGGRHHPPLRPQQLEKNPFPTIPKKIKKPFPTKAHFKLGGK